MGQETDWTPFASPRHYLGYRLRTLRRARGWSQRELSGIAQVESSDIARIERAEPDDRLHDVIDACDRALGARGELADLYRMILAAGASGGGQTVADQQARPATADQAAAGSNSRQSLPRDTATFTGREEELEALVASLESAGGGILAIHAVDGLAGVGKSAFAIHAAHRLSGRFPDGQVFLPLHAHTPGTSAISAHAALATLLLGDGLDPGNLPDDTEARAELWRARTAKRRMLLVLDDAESSTQVQLLLPAAPGTLVLITSRRRLTGLPDAVPLSLESLPPGAAAMLFVRTVRRALDPADPAIARLAELCGRLPLAIRMLAARLRHHPAWTTGDLLAELTEHTDRLAGLYDENFSVTAALDLSYRDLNADQRRLFRLLGVHPGPEADAFAGAALVATDRVHAAQLLGGLEESRLIDEPVHGRYRMHDLVREYARTRARADAREAQTAVNRLLDYYQSAASLAERHVDEVNIQPLKPVPGTPATMPDLDDRDTALAWMRAERANLLAALDHAAAEHDDARVVGLSAAMAGFLDTDGPWQEAAALHHAAAVAAHRLTDPSSEANAHFNRGRALYACGYYSASIAAYERAAALYLDLREDHGEARARNLLGVALSVSGRYAAAAAEQEQVLAICRRPETADRLGELRAMDRLARVRLMMGDFDTALTLAEQTLAGWQDVGDKKGQARILDVVASLRPSQSGLPTGAQLLAQALDTYRDIDERRGYAQTLLTLNQWSADGFTGLEPIHAALAIYGDLDDRHGRATALAQLGSAQYDLGDRRAALDTMQQALNALDELGEHRDRALYLHEMAWMLHDLGDLSQAITVLQNALQHYRAIEFPAGEAGALLDLAQMRSAHGDQAEELTVLLDQATALFDALHRHDKTEFLVHLAFVKQAAGLDPTPADPCAPTNAEDLAQLRETWELYQRDPDRRAAARIKQRLTEFEAFESS